LVILTSRLVDEAARLAHERDLQITASLPPGPVMVRGDAVRLEQVVSNLLSNALKYTPSGGRVDVTVAGGSEATITVADTGVGIADDAIGGIFEPFTQVDRTLDRAQGGMGLGLSLVHALARLHGGDVTARSEGLGRGSTFTVRLPAMAPDAAEVVPQAELPPRAAPARRVLIVEDGADHRESLAELLRLFGHRVDTAMDGEQGIELALALHPEVALVDIGLPRADGYEVARQIRAALGATVSLVAVTGYGQPDDRARSLAAGFDAHLTKPVALRTVHRLLASLSPARSAGVEP
jgi:CheY-like chemotaxis protein